MKTIQIIIALIFILLFTSLNGTFAADREDGVINIRLSYKIICNPKNGMVPKIRSGLILSDEIIEKTVDEMNKLLDGYGRGYRFQLCEIKKIGCLQREYPEPGYWYNIDFVNNKNCDALHIQMGKTIKKNPKKYAWNENAINIYINEATTGGKWFINDVIIVGVRFSNIAWIHLHEIGHYFNLHHTHGSQNSAMTNSTTGQDQSAPGDDHVEDTIDDLATWSRNDIAVHNFSVEYEKLTHEQKIAVDYIAENIMSYHHLDPVQAQLTRLTEGQLDRWANTADEYFTRRKVRDGRTIFVSTDKGNGKGRVGSHCCPYKTVNNAVEKANLDGGDILLLKPGVYNESITIDKPLTLRATRKGSVSIGIAGNTSSKEPMLALN